MEKPDNCPECGGFVFSEAEVAVTAELHALDKNGRPAQFAMPTLPLSFSVAGWHCDNCDYEEPDQDALGKYLARETEKILKKAIAEMN